MTLTLPSTATLVATLTVYALALALVRRARTAALLTAYFLACIALSSWIKQRYLGAALSYADVDFFVRRLIANLRLFVEYPSLGLTLLGMFAGGGAIAWFGRRREPALALLQRPRVGPTVRTALAALGLSLAGIAQLQARPDPAATPNNIDSWVAFLAMDRARHTEGVLGRLNLFFEERSYEPTMPPRITQAHFGAAAPTAGSADAGAVAVPAAAAARLRPDVLLVLEESTFDPRWLPDCPAAICDPAMLHPPEHALRTVQGPLLVHTTGGGTILTEFAVLSGLDWRVFGRGGGYAPISLAPRLHRSLPATLRALGYRTIAVYPTDGDFLGGRSAYENYGFDEFLDARALGLPSDWGHVSDATLFERALAHLHDADARPVLLFVLTIRNHGPHGIDPGAVPPAFRAVAAQTSMPIADYLARMHASSDAYTLLASRWLAAPRPRVIGWFGDHQPEAAWQFTGNPERLDAARVPPGLAREQLQFVTWYQLSANFPATGELPQSAVLDLAYLGPVALAFAGLPADAGSRAALQFAAECRGLMLTCPDRRRVAEYLSYRVHELHDVE